MSGVPLLRRFDKHNIGASREIVNTESALF